MTRFVIDADVLLGIADGTIQVDARHRLVAPGGVRSDALALLYAAVRRGEMDRKTAFGRLERMTAVRSGCATTAYRAASPGRSPKS